MRKHLFEITSEDIILHNGREVELDTINTLKGGEAIFLGGYYVDNGDDFRYTNDINETILVLS
jgi:hypothetical protein